VKEAMLFCSGKDILFYLDIWGMKGRKFKRQNAKVKCQNEMLSEK
jgi:hypothetical protein